MTDKTQKIREEVVRMHNLLPVMDGDNISVNYADRICTTLEMYIDSLQEEPIFKVGDTIQKKGSNSIYSIINKTSDGYRVLRGLSDTIVIWFSEQDQWELVEEPVSEDLEEAIEKSFIYHDNRGDDFRSDKQIETAYRCGFEAGAKWQKSKDESTTEDLEKAAGNYAFTMSGEDEVSKYYAFKAGAKWQKEHLWKPADGDDLPIIDREVIALLDNGKVVFAHRPLEYWDGKNIDTGEVTRYYPKTYDKGGWNLSDVKYWLDVELPKEIEEL